MIFLLSHSYKLKFVNSVILKNMICYAVIAILCVLLIICQFEREFFKFIVFALVRLLVSLICFFMVLLVVMLTIVMGSMYGLIYVLTRIFGCYDPELMNHQYILKRILERLLSQLQPIHREQTPKKVNPVQEPIYREQN